MVPASDTKPLLSLYLQYYHREMEVAHCAIAANPAGLAEVSFLRQR